MKKKLTRKLTLGCFIGYIGCFTIANLFSGSRDISYNENRTLASAPSMELQHILSGRFDDDFEKWFSDQFVARDFWIELKAGIRRLSGAVENNDVYFARDGRLIQRFASYNEETLKTNAGIVNEFCEENGITGNVLLVPTAAWGAASELPAGAYDIDQEDLINDAAELFAKQNFIRYTDYASPSPSLYFRTDHHWNEKGAYLGYEALADKVLHKQPNSFTYETVSTDFCGTMYSQSGAFWNSSDSICRIIPETPVETTVNYDGQYTENSIYSEKRLNEKDKYMYYTDGNHAYISIQTDADTNRKAVLIKDSYSHIMIPYLITEYSEITMIDLRYYHSPVSQLIEDKENTDLCFIYSLDNFCKDPNLAFLR